MVEQVIVVMVAIGAYTTIGFGVAIVYDTWVEDVDDYQELMALMMWPLLIPIAAIKLLIRAWKFIGDWRASI